MTFIEKENFTEEDILNILNSKLEESINIEFKSSGALSKDNMVKKEISKDISAFANSDGGIIFYGINEENHVAKSLSYIDGNEFTKEWLENIIISTIQQKIDEIRIIPVRFENDITKTIYVVKIPVSNRRPHINNDKKYYKRYNFQSIPMEEYEVRNLYHKSYESKVYVSCYVVKPIKEEQDCFGFFIELQISTNGNYVSEKYKVKCNINSNESVLLETATEKKYSLTHRLDDGITISTTEMFPIFPNEILSVLSFTVKFPKKKFNEIIKETTFDVFVFSGNELEEAENTLIDLIIKVKEKYYT